MFAAVSVGVAGGFGGGVAGGAVAGVAGVPFAGGGPVTDFFDGLRLLAAPALVAVAAGL